LRFETESVKDQQQETKPLKKQIKPILSHLLGKGGYGEVYYGK